MTISASAAELGDYQTVREGTIAGPGGQILLNAAYVAYPIPAIATPHFALEIQTPQHPAVFKPSAGRASYLLSCRCVRVGKKAYAMLDRPLSRGAFLFYHVILNEDLDEHTM